ncbi:STAS domain-containing protein [Robertkochia marina]|uniref:STAS domain-containing protein n=1 Tax=Robertkochia marina TaxID=1227945 RepID=A0A4S3M0A6_9FLAO|nr:STAS domain-containing protein [Robertkochia marina]THD67598.1 STAS domain-containing protein [Robertkochia marina]TRZ44533.1 STAS domain-containing protein [Robertkochia marina]
MALRITEVNGIFEVNGNLLASNAYQLRKHFEAVLQIKKHIRINLGHLETLDTGSIGDLRSLISYATRNGKFIEFLGKSNRKVCKVLKAAGL